MTKDIGTKIYTFPLLEHHYYWRKSEPRKHGKGSKNRIADSHRILTSDESNGRRTAVRQVIES